LSVPSASATKDMKGHMKLLAVSEGGTQVGSLADLYLEIREGHGSVYIDTFPLTKMDTQLSTRFAKEVACKFLDQDNGNEYNNIDCKKYDFFYTIKAGSSIIGGPSAGAALAMLTVALLDPEVKQFDESVTITGTINTGGIIGSVGAVKEKIEAAAQNNITKVLVPIGSKYVFNETKLNETVGNIINIISNASNGSSMPLNSSIDINSINISDVSNISIIDSINSINITAKNYSDQLNLTEFGTQNNIQIIEVLTLADALKEFTGKEYEAPTGEIALDDFYSKKMSKISGEICSRSYVLKAKLDEAVENKENTKAEGTREGVGKGAIKGVGKGAKEGINSGIMSKEELLNNSYYNQSQELLNTKELVMQSGSIYSAASYCFGANINYDYLILINANMSIPEKVKKIRELFTAINNSNAILDKTPLTSFNDLQTYMIVKERLVEAYNTWELASQAMEANQTDVEYEIAYVTERLFSAYSWSHFFTSSEETSSGIVKSNYILDNATLSESCKTIVSEAQERIEYFRIIYPYPDVPLLESANKDVQRALDNFNTGQFKVCIMHASKAKSEIDAVLSTLQLEDEELARLLEAKLGLAKDVILKQQQKGLFPIQGYSYYEYANALSKNDKISALIYSQYALEFSNLDLYFSKVEPYTAYASSFIEPVIIFIKEDIGIKAIIAFFIGIAVASVIFVGGIVYVGTRSKKESLGSVSIKNYPSSQRVRKAKRWK
jgi:predicted S18 family serine protease